MILTSRPAGSIGHAVHQRLAAIDPHTAVIAPLGPGGAPEGAMPADAALRTVQPERRASWLRAMHGVDRLVLCGIGTPDDGYEGTLRWAAEAAQVPRIVRISPVLPGLEGHPLLGRHAMLDEAVARQQGIVLRIAPSYQDLTRLTVRRGSSRILVHALSDGRLPFIDERDVLAAVALVLQKPGFPPGVHTLTGPQQLSIEDVVTAFRPYMAGHVTSHPTTETGLFAWLGERGWDSEEATAMAARLGAGRHHQVAATRDVERILGVEARPLASFVHEQAVRLHATGHRWDVHSITPEVV